jgi:indole-3-glycerol phosphate synthase
MATYLDDIVAQHRSQALLDRRNTQELEASLIGAPPTRDFAAALRSVARRGESVAVIAEVKRRSPKTGALNPGLDPAALAEIYARAGAACLSVLTDGPHFGGSAEDLRAARARIALPVLRKDFTVAEADLYDARAMGADAVLLIAAVLDDHELAIFLTTAEMLGLDALVEVHDEDELDRAVSAGASMIGVNQRDLHTFAVDGERALKLVKEIPDSCLRVAESGIKTRDQVLALIDAGYDGILVGEALVTAPDPGEALLTLARGRS